MKHLAPYIRDSKQSQTLLMSQLSRERAASGQQIFRFGFGQSPFPVPTEVQDALAQSAGRKEYMSVQGHPPLREAIASFHNRMENKDWNAGQIIVGAGSKILIYCLLAALKRADVILPAPSWVSYEPQAMLAGHNVSWIVTSYEDQWRLTPESLERHCRHRADTSVPLVLVLNYPGNPTGQTYSPGQLQRLAEVMRRHKIIVIADEIYSLLSYESSYATLEEFYPEACIVSSGLSKWCGAGGWRLGFVRIPDEIGDVFFQAVLGIASETYSCAPGPIQIAATRAYGDHQFARAFLEQQIRLLREVGQYCSNTLQQAGVRVHAAQGGFYLFPAFDRFRENLIGRGLRTSAEFTSALMADTGVALLPGSAFGMPAENMTARLAFVDFDGEQISSAGGHEPAFPRVKQGIGEICSWLGAPLS